MRRFLRRLFRWTITALVVLLGILTINAIRFHSRQIAVSPLPDVPLAEGAFDRLSEAVQIPTVSRRSGIDSSAFQRLDSFLMSAFPLAQRELERTRLAGYSLLYRWPGRNNKLNPILLLAHLDVVPVETSSAEQWTHPPFSGFLADDHVWGRGTLDDKMSALGMLEAVEMLLRDGYYPERTVYLAFGHDEELDGTGAQSIAAHLQGRGEQIEYILDEGLLVLENALPGLDPPVALVGIAEKGYASLKLTLELQEGGHSMMPPERSAIGDLSEALLRLQEQPFPGALEGVLDQFFDYIGPEMGLFSRIAIANRWLTAPLLVRRFSDDPATNALVRTTAAPTMIDAGVADNVLPVSAEATVNLRIRPGETVESAVAYVKQIIDDDRIRVEVIRSGAVSDPSPVTSTETFGFRVVEKTIRERFPTAIVAPSLVIGRTDSRHYEALQAPTYRFTPIQVQRADLSRFHGLDERISLENYRRLIRFYHQLIKNSCK